VYQLLNIKRRCTFRMQRIRVSCYSGSKWITFLCNVPRLVLWWGRSVFVVRQKSKDLFLFFCDVSAPLSSHDLLIVGVWRKLCFLGAFAKLRKATVRFGMEKLVYCWTDLMAFHI
jgi:hypothetical protein